jgi:hypothetical protein
MGRHAIPLPSAARGRSRTVLYPGIEVARDLFGRVGDVVVPSEEQALDVFGAATATFVPETVRHGLDGVLERLRRDGLR